MGIRVPTLDLDLEMIVDAVARVAGDRPAPLHAPEFRGREWDYVKSCIDEGWVSSVGTFVDRFEAELAAATGVEHAVAVSSGTAALHVALLLAGVERDDEVLIPTVTFIATANAVSYCGGVPHFVDSEWTTLGLDPDKLSAYLDDIVEMRDSRAVNRDTGRTIRAVVPVHVFGHPVRMAALKAVAERFNIAVVEDATESLGTIVDGRPPGGDGLMGVLSFNGNKVVTTGGGGAILTDDDALARRAKHLTTTARVAHAWEFAHDEVGFNYRLPNINAALGCAQLERLDDVVARKRLLAARYAESLAEVPGVSFYVERDGVACNYWLNALVLNRDNAAARDPLLRALNDRKLFCRPVWTPMHELPMYAGCPRMDLSVATDIVAHVINLPSSPCLADSPVAEADPRDRSEA